MKPTSEQPLIESSAPAPATGAAPHIDRDPTSLASTSTAQHESSVSDPAAPAEAPHVDAGVHSMIIAANVEHHRIDTVSTLLADPRLSGRQMSSVMKATLSSRREAAETSTKVAEPGRHHYGSDERRAVPERHVNQASHGSSSRH